MNWTKILEGWRNHLMPPKELKMLIEQVSEERLAICKVCEFNSTEGEIKAFSYCKCCGCPLQAKSKSLSSNCGIEELIKENPYTDKQLKWTAVVTRDEHRDIQNKIDEEESEQHD
jgi:hypothetical protein